MSFFSSSSVVTAKATPRRFARSVAILLTVCTMLALAVSSAPVASAAAAPAGIDLIVTAVGPSTCPTGANVVPTATVKNQGTVATPAGKILDVAFLVEGTTVWSDTKTTSLAAGCFGHADRQRRRERHQLLGRDRGRSHDDRHRQLGQPHHRDQHDQQHARRHDHRTRRRRATWSSPRSAPASAATGAKVVPSATVKNQGTVATPAGTILDVAFVIEGTTTVWSDTKTTVTGAGCFGHADRQRWRERHQLLDRDPRVTTRSRRRSTR